MVNSRARRRGSIQNTYYFIHKNKLIAHSTLDVKCSQCSSKLIFFNAFYIWSCALCLKGKGVALSRAAIWICWCDGERLARAVGWCHCCLTAISWLCLVFLLVFLSGMTMFHLSPFPGLSRNKHMQNYFSDIAFLNLECNKTRCPSLPYPSAIADIM